MRILRIDAEPFHVLEYLVGDGAGKITAVLPFHRAYVEALPPTLQALIATSDLQGVEYAATGCGTPRPLGEVVAFEIDRLRNAGSLPAKESTGAILAGDFYPRADEGDVLPVWRAFAETCRWIAGVAGNHDAFGDKTTAAEARIDINHSAAHFLDEDTFAIDGLIIGGISGAVGRPGESWARSESAFAAAIAKLAHGHPDILISHDGPNISETNLSGWPSVRRVLETAPPTLLIRGHDPWPTPLAALPNGTQLLNVEGRVIVLIPEHQAAHKN